MKRPIEVFCCAADSDQAFLKELRAQLAVQERRDIITLWDRSEIPGGADVNREIDRHLASAGIFLLFISPDFLNDDYCYVRVMKTALARQARGEATAIPMIVRSADWESDDALARLQVLPKNGKPISSQENRDAAFREIVREINSTVQRLETSPAIPPGKPLLDSSSSTSTTSGRTLPVSSHHEFIPPSSPEPGSMPGQIPPPVSSPRISKSFAVLLVALACVLVVGLALVVSRSFAQNTGPASTPSPTTTHIAASPSVRTAASPSVTLPAFQQANFASNLIPTGQAPAVNDPLKDNSQGYAWDEETQADGSCHFAQGQYLLSAPAGSNGVGCNPENAKGLFSNFVYQIEMTILAGVGNGQSGAGPTFRVNTDGSGQQYQVAFTVSGYWNVQTDAMTLTSTGTPCSNPCPFFNNGVNEPNVITISASGKSIQVQINGHLLGSYTDSAYTSGYIGVQISPGTTKSSVAFSHVRVWTL